MKKSGIFGWGVVYPIKVDGKINWKNLLIGGNWMRFTSIVFLILLVILCISEYSSIVQVANECLNQSKTIQVNVSQWLN